MSAAARRARFRSPRVVKRSGSIRGLGRLMVRTGSHSLRTSVRRLWRRGFHASSAGRRVAIARRPEQRHRLVLPGGRRRCSGVTSFQPASSCDPRRGVAVRRVVGVCGALVGLGRRVRMGTTTVGSRSPAVGRFGWTGNESVASRGALGAGWRLHYRERARTSAERGPGPQLSAGMRMAQSGS